MKEFKNPTIEVEIFEVADVIATSTPNINGDISGEGEED